MPYFTVLLLSSFVSHVMVTDSDARVEFVTLVMTGWVMSTAILKNWATDESTLPSNSIEF